jgi:hypothetical protein
MNTGLEGTVANLFQLYWASERSISPRRRTSTMIAIRSSPRPRPRRRISADPDRRSQAVVHDFRRDRLASNPPLVSTGSRPQAVVRERWFRGGNREASQGRPDVQAASDVCPLGNNLSSAPAAV